MMKRIPTLFLLFLTAFVFSAGASAADYAVNNVSMDSNAVTVNVTAESNCALFVGLYDKDGRLLSVQTRDVAATTGHAVSVSIPGGIPVGSSAKAFLTGADSKPLCKAVSISGDNAPVQDGDVYAILYMDGAMVFQYGNAPEAGREVRETYAVDITKNYSSSEIPWSKARAFIYQVDFAGKIQPMSTAYWFYRCVKLEEISNIKNLDTSNVVDMRSMFESCVSLETLDVSNFNTANVSNMSHMFSDCGQLMTLNVTDFNTANVTNMCAMFDNCGRLTTLDVSGFNTANVTNMRAMFSGCGALITLNVSTFDTVSVIDMSWMFHGCGALMTLDISNFNTANVTDMCAMFDGCGALTTLDVSNFNTANVTDMLQMFLGCGALRTLDVSNFNTDSVTTMNKMFSRCRALRTLDVSNFNTANVLDIGGMFSGCYALTTIYASNQFVTNQLADNTTMMFSMCYFLVGGNSTVYDSAHIDKEYAHIDGGPDNPGYFTAK